jgi:hypothetical protein
VTDYGADPTGRLDSTEALQQAISDAFGSPVDTHLMEGVADLGGTEVHLDGGTYKISRPLRLPDTSGGNFMVRCPITFFHFFFLKKKKLFFSIIDQFNI